MAIMDRNFVYPTEWYDDETMGFMIEPLPETRDEDEEQWDQKVSFWEKLIRAALDSQDSPLTFTPQHLYKLFTWHGHHPKALEEVLYVLNGKEIVPSRQILHANKGLLLRLIPSATNTLAGLASSLLNMSLGTTPRKTIKEQEYVLLSVLERRSNDLMACMLESCVAPLDYIMPMNAITNKFPNLSASQLNLLLESLISRGHAIMCEPPLKRGNSHRIDSTLQVIKFGRDGDRPTSTGADFTVGELRHTISNLEHQLSKVSGEIDVQLTNIRQLIQTNNKKRALHPLRLKKRLEIAYNNLHTHLENVTKVLASIDDLSTQKEVLDCMKHGADALQGLQNDWQMDAESVDEVMEKVSESISRVQEVEQAMSAPLDEDQEGLDKELEGELESLMQLEFVGSRVSRNVAATTTSAAPTTTIAVEESPRLAPPSASALTAAQNASRSKNFVDTCLVAERFVLPTSAKGQSESADGTPGPKITASLPSQTDGVEAVQPESSQQVTVLM